MGPMLGFMLGSFSLSKFVIPSLKPTISQRDPRWIGAWWLGKIRGTHRGIGTRPTCELGGGGRNH